MAYPTWQARLLKLAKGSAKPEIRTVTKDIDESQEGDWILFIMAAILIIALESTTVKVLCLLPLLVSDHKVKSDMEKLAIVLTKLLIHV